MPRFSQSRFVSIIFAVARRFTRWVLRGAIYASLLLGFLAAVADAATRQWSASVTTGSWGTVTNWGGNIPGSSDIAAFGNITAATDVTLDGFAAIVSQINVTDTNSANVTIDTGTGGTLTLAGAATLNTTQSRTLTINAVLAGTAGLDKTGNGTVVLTNAGNTLTGGINVTAGTLTFSTGALGTNVVSAGGGTLNWAAGNTQDISSQINIADSAVTTLSANSQTITLATAFQTGTNGTGSVIKSNPGTFIITAANTYTGGTTINNGTLILTGGDNRLSINGGISFGNGANAGTLQLGDSTGPSNQTVTSLTVLGTSNLANNKIVGGNASVSILTVNLSADDVFAGTLGGTGTNNNNLALTKAGAAKLTLSAVNKYTGGTNVNAGTLALGIANALAATGVVNVGGGTLDLAGFSDTVGAVTLSGGSIVNSGAAATLTGSSYAVQSGVISAALGGATSALTKSTGGTVTLSGADTYGGGTNVNAGVLVLGSTGALPAGGAVNIGGGTLDLGGFSQSVGTVTLASGGIINSGGGATLTGTGYVVQSGTINAVIGGTGSTLTKASDGSASGGTVTLTAANTFTGLTSVNAGTLNVVTTHAGGGAFAVGDGATLGVNLGAAGQSLVTSTLTLGTASGGTLAFNLSTFGDATAPVISTGALTLNGVNIVNITASGLSVGEFPLIWYTGSIGGAGSLTLGTLPARVTATIDTVTVPQEILLNVTGFDIPKWTGAVNGNWDIDDGSGTVGTLNWKLSNNTATGYYQGGAVGTDSVLFDNTATNKTVNLTTTLTPIAITVNNDNLAGDTYTFTGVGKLSGAATLTKQGSGTLILANTGTNDFSGAITITSGTIQAGDGVTAGAGQLGSGNILLNGGAITLDRPAGDDFTLANALSGAGSLIQQGGDVVTITGNNASFSGSFNVNSGTLKLGSLNGLGAASVTVQSGAILDVTSFSVGNTLAVDGGTVLASSGTATTLSGSVTLNGGGIADVATGATFTVSGSIGGTGALTKTDGGLLILSGNSNYAGTTAINAGTLQLGNVNALGGATNEATVATGATLDLAGFAIGQALELDGGTLRSSTGAGGGLSGAVTLGASGGIVDVASGATLTLSNTVGGGGALTKTSAGTLVLSGSNNFSGGVNLNVGALVFGAPASVPATGTISYAAGTILAFDFAFDQNLLNNSVAPTFSAGTIALGADNANNLDFTNYAASSLGAMGNATYSGNLTPSGVNYNLGGGGGTLTFASQLTGGNNLIVGATGPGTVILTAANSFTGGTTVTAGTLRLGNAAALGPVANPLTVNGTLDLNGFNLTVGSLTAAATGVITDNSTTPGITVLTDNTATASTTYAGSISNGANGRVLALVKDGTGTLILNKASGNNYSGGTTVIGGILEIRDNNAQVLLAGSSLTFAGTSTFRAANNGTGAGSLALGTLTFSAGEGTVQSDQESTGTTNTLTFASTSTRLPGATGNFTLATATDPSKFKVVFTTIPATGQSLDGGIFFAGSDFAAYDATGHYVRALNYATDSNATSVVLAADQATLGSITGKDVQLIGTGNITDQGTDTVRTLKIAGANNLTLDSAATLTVSAGGILKTGGNAATISGGVEVDTGGEGDLVVRTAAAADVLTLASTISSQTAGGLTASGSGTLILSGNNSFTGTINILGGTLQLGSATGFGTSSDGIVEQSGAVLDVAGFSTNKAVQVNAAILRSSTGTGSLSGPVTLNGSGTLDVATGATLTLSNIISGSGSLTKTSLGTAALTAVNSFTGGVTITSGTLRITNSLGLGAGVKTISIANVLRPSLALDGSGGNISLGAGLSFLTSSDGTTNTSGAIINLAGNNVINGSISLNNGGGGNTDILAQGGTLTLAGNITAASSATSTRTLILDGAASGMVSGSVSDGGQLLGITKQGTGTWQLTGANTFTGVTAIAAGDLQINSIGLVGTVQPLGEGTTPITLGTATTTGTFEYTGSTAATLGRPVTVNGVGGGIIENSGGALLTLGGTLTTSGRPLTLTGGAFNVAGQIVGTAANSSLTVNNAVVTLGNTNSYNGPTKVYGGGDLLNATVNALPIVSALTIGEATHNTGGTYDLNGFNQTIAGLNSAGAGANVVTNSGATGVSTLAIAGPGVFNGTIRDGVSPTALTTNAGAAQTLSGASTYTGATIVNGGTLIVSGSLNGTTSVAVSNGGTLGGNGVITTGGNGSVTVASGGSLAPGNGPPGQLTFALGSGVLDLSAAAGGTGYLQFALGLTSDEIALTSGSFSIGTGLLSLSDFSFSNSGGFGQGAYVLFNSNTPIVGSLGANLSGQVLGYNATLGFANGGDELVLSVAPEPGAFVFLTGGLGTLVGFQRFRRRTRRSPR